MTRSLLCTFVHLYLFKFFKRSRDSYEILFLIALAQINGGMWCFTGEFDNEYYVGARDKLSALDKGFDFDYFKSIITSDELLNKSVKEVLATKQRIPGLGNGVLQDILYNAKIFPKRKIQTLSQEEMKKLFDSVKNTLIECSHIYMTYDIGHNI